MAERSIIVRFRAEVAQFRANTTAASNTLSEFSKRSNDAARKHRTDWDQVGRQTAIAGVAIAAGLGIGIKRFADFDQAMSGAAAGTRATVNELGALREAAIKAGADTPFSATEAAQAITEMGKAGVATKDILGGGLNGALNLAAAGQLEVGRAAEIAATALNQFGLKGVNVAHVSDLYAAAAGKAQGSVEDVAQAMKFAGVTANSMGVSIEETTGTIGLFASKGIIGEQAGTTFRSMLLSLTSPSKIAKQAMEDLGISVYDASGKFVGVQGAAEELHNVLGPLDEATRNQALGQIFGNESMNGAIALYQGGAAAVQDWTKRVNDAGYAQEQAAKLTDNWKGDIERLGGSLDAVLVKNGSSVNGALRGMTQGLEDAVDGFGALPAPVQTTAVAVTAVTAAAAILGGGMLYMVPKIAAGKAAIVELGLASEATATKGLNAAGKAAKFLGGAMVALTIAGNVGGGKDPLKAWGDRKLAADLLGSADALDVLNKRFAESATQVTGPLSGGSDLGVKKFSDALKASIDPSALEQFDAGFSGIFATFGFKNLSNVNVAAKRLGEVDAVLTQMVASGNQKQAGEIFSQLAINGARAGFTLEQVKDTLPGYTEAMAQVASESTNAAVGVDAVGDSANKAAGAFGAAEGAGGATASAMLLLGDNASLAKDQVEELAKVIQSDMDAASKAFQSSTDVLGKYDPAAAAEKAKAASQKVADAEQAAQDVRERVAAKKKRTVTDTQALDRAASAVDKARAEEKVANANLGAAGLTAMYRNTITEARAFTKDIDEVAKRGLDPNSVAKLLQEGPEKAAPALEALLGKNSANLIKLSNNAEAEIRKINSRVVEQSRLTSLALNSTTDQMGADLDVAMAIAAAKAGAGGKATGEAIAHQLRLSLPEVQRIATEFGIVLASTPPPPPISLTVDTREGLANLRDARQQLANLDGAVIHTTLEVRIANTRDARQDAANSRGLAQPKPVLVDPTTGKKPSFAQSFGGPVPGYAFAGPIPGYSPNPRADNIDIRATAGEHMWSVEEVKGAGGHGVISQLRALARSGQLGGVRAGMGASSSAASHSETYADAFNFYGDIKAPDLAAIQRDAEDRRRLANLGRRRSR